MLGEDGNFYYLNKDRKNVKRKTKIRVICKDGKERRFADGADESRVLGQNDCLPVICLECGYNFGFYTIYERTIPFLKEHSCSGGKS